MKKTILPVVFLFLSLSLSARPGLFKKDKDLPFVNPKPIYLEAHLAKQDSGIICFVSYRVSLYNLVFTKNDGDYVGGITLNVEAVKEDGSVVRGAVTEEVCVKNYSDTEARNKFLQGVLSFRLDEYISELNPLVTILNTEREFPLPPIRLASEPEELTRPLVVSRINTVCPSGNASYKLANFENLIPLGDEDSGLLLPVLDSTITNVKVEVKQNDTVVRNETLSNSVSSSFIFEKCSSNIVLNEDADAKDEKYFLLPEISKGLGEGHFQLSVFDRDSLLYSKSLDVVWVEKPRSLFDSEYAYKLLSLIVSKDTLKSILKGNDNDYYLALKAFWDKRNPEKGNPFNALEAEFYKRVDYALKEFAVQGESNEYLTDRGEIYVKYGKPSDVKRVYSGKDELTEVWEYDELNLQFIFVDKSGFGNFRLQ